VLTGVAPTLGIPRLASPAGLPLVHANPIYIAPDQVRHLRQPAAPPQSFYQPHHRRTPGGRPVEKQRAVEQIEERGGLWKLLAQHRDVRPAHSDVAGQTRLLDQVRQRCGRQHLCPGGNRDADDVRLLTSDVGKDAAAEDIHEQVVLRIARRLEQLPAAIQGRRGFVAQEIEPCREGGQRSQLERACNTQERDQAPLPIVESRTAEDRDRLFDLSRQARALLQCPS